MSEQAARKQEAPKELVRSHQPGQATFRAILAEDIEWKPFAAFPPEAQEEERKDFHEHQTGS